LKKGGRMSPAEFMEEYEEEKVKAYVLKIPST
jgi:hypothetical protein